MSLDPEDLWNWMDNLREEGVESLSTLGWHLFRHLLTIGQAVRTANNLTGQGDHRNENRLQRSVD